MKNKKLICIPRFDKELEERRKTTAEMLANCPTFQARKDAKKLGVK